MKQKFTPLLLLLPFLAVTAIVLYVPGLARASP